MSQKNMFSFLDDEALPFFEPHSTSRSQLSLGTTSRTSMSSRTWKKSALEPRPSFSKSSLEKQTRWGGFIPKKGESWGSVLYEGKKPRPASRVCPPKTLDYGTVEETMTAWSGGKPQQFRFVGRYAPKKIIVRCGDKEVEMYYCKSALTELHEREKERALRASGEIFRGDGDKETTGTLEKANL